MFGSPFLDFGLMIFLAPAFLLAMAAQWMVKSAYNQMSQVGASVTGFQAARRILDARGLYDVNIESVAGRLSDHYDPRAKVGRRSQENDHGKARAAGGRGAGALAYGPIPGGKGASNLVSCTILIQTKSK